MAWIHANDGTLYDGPTHTLAGTVYTGATRKPGTRRLSFIAEAKVDTVDRVDRAVLAPKKTKKKKNK